MRWIASGITVASLFGLGGCKWMAAPHFDTPQPVVADLPQTVRVIPAPDASAIQEPTATPLPTNYYNLTADQCRDLAYRNSSVANLIESSVMVQPGPFNHLTGQDCVDLMRVSAAEHLSREARNRTAATALTLYYQLLELELKSDVLNSTIQEVDTLVRTADILREKGFKEQAETYELRKQRIELAADAAKLRSGIQKLNSELKALLAIDPCVPGLLLPADQVRVAPEPLDAEFAVQIGLSRRSDLNLLRTLIGSTNSRTVPAVRRVLRGLTPLLGAVMPGEDSPPLLPFVSGMAKAEADHVQRQLQSALRDREREAVKEIRTAVEEWETARDLVAIARKKFTLGEERVTEFEKRKQTGQGVELQLSRAKLDLLKLEADLLGEIAKWKRADVRAREVLGLLCGD